MDAALNKDQVRTIYRRFASTYDFWSSLMESKARLRCLEMADIKNGESVLEVAVGTGVLFEKLLKSNPRGRNEGIDLSNEMLSQAIERLHKSGESNYALKIGDAYHLQYPDNSFDLVLNNYMFDLIPEKDFGVILSEFKRVLRKDGRIVIVSMTKGPHWFDIVWELFYKIQPSLLGGCRGVALMPYLKRVGFEKIRREYIIQMLFPSEVICGIKP